MIRSFKCKDTENLAKNGDCRRFRAIARIALRKLDMVDAAISPETLRIPPGNRLEALHGDREGQWSIRINDKWRLCFRWEADGARDVEIVDYH
ncbi:MAG: type II toxin-antitoxin system RelE/ParE family toxin [Kiritimatiellae bacterium]|nr:type II toxin-antitoxin system RelE/ParE family toxin [Kiritimatiellia bacterium]